MTDDANVQPQEPGDGASANVGGSEEKKSQQGCGIGCLGFIVAFIVLVGSCSLMGGDSNSGDSPEVRRQGAISACEDWVSDQLKAPASAEFGRSSATGSGPWTVTGTVDAQNSFGAMIRSSWTCEVRLDGDTFRGRAVLND